MKIAIDIQGAQSASRSRGIGKYTSSLAKAIIANRGHHEIILIINGYFIESVQQIKAEFETLICENNIKIWYPSGDTLFIDSTANKRRACAEITREFFLAGFNPDVVLVCSLFEGLSDPVAVSIKKVYKSIPTAVILYDLIPLIHPEMYLPNVVLKDWYSDRVENIKRADLLLSISESSRMEAIEHLGLNENIVVNISAAADECFKPIPVSAESASALCSKFGLQRPFLMYTGGLDHRKNVDGLIRSYAALAPALRARHQLAVVCDLGIQKQTLEKLCIECNLKPDEIVFTGFVSEKDLLQLYNLCFCFVFPSWHEGFGLPVLEAMSCGRAVIGADATSIPEIINCKEARFNPFDIVSITSLITKILTDDDFRIELEKKGLDRAKMFSWKFTAIKAIKALEMHFQTNSAGGEREPPTELLPALMDSMVSMAAMPDSEVEFIRLAHALSLTFPLSEID